MARERTRGDCSHAGCGCPSSPEASPYCSGYCANASHDEPPAGACACGHAHCIEEQRVRAGGERTVTAVGSDPAAAPGDGSNDGSTQT